MSVFLSPYTLMTNGEAFDRHGVSPLLIFPRLLARRASLGEGQGLGRLVHVQRLQDLGEIMDPAQKAHGKQYLDWFWMPNLLLGNVQPATLLKDPANGPELVKQVLSNSLMGGVV